MKTNQNSISACIVDDDPMWVAILSKMLSDLKITSVNFFSKGEDFLKSDLTKESLIFLDYEMNEMNGLEVLMELKNNYPHLSIIFCSGKEDLSVAMRALTLGSTDFLLKSNINKKEVAQIINRLNVTN